MPLVHERFDMNGVSADYRFDFLAQHPGSAYAGKSGVNIDITNAESLVFHESNVVAEQDSRADLGERGL